jgi:hypothetical protein
MKKLIVIALAIYLSGCFSTPAREVVDICQLLDEKVSWYQSAKKSEKKYQAPMHIMLAIIYQESHFASRAQPARKTYLGFIPGARPSSSYGYAQAKTETWEWYRLKTGYSGASRSNFDDSIDFVGWYINQSNKRSKISKSDAYNQYLAYHEGHNGFNKESYKEKSWLLKVAKQVEKKSNDFKQQLLKCRSQLDKNRIWSFF